jgi:hypothetical protein
MRYGKCFFGRLMIAAKGASPVERRMSLPDGRSGRKAEVAGTAAFDLKSDLYGLTVGANGHDSLQPLALILFFFSPLLRWKFGRLGLR